MTGRGTKHVRGKWRHHSFVYRTDKILIALPPGLEIRRKLLPLCAAYLGAAELLTLMRRRGLKGNLNGRRL